MSAEFLDLDTIPAPGRYKLLTGLVIPRPVAWVTTQDADGVVNAAPYSFSNVFGHDPAVIILGLQHHPDGSPKDIERNIDATGEFVVNLATPALLDDMVDSAAAYAPGESEAKARALEFGPSGRVRPPRLGDAPVAMEPGRMHVYWDGDFPVARLFADRYARLEEIAPRSIPQPRAFRDPAEESANRPADRKDRPR